VCPAPLPHPLDIVRPLEIIWVFLGPPPLTFRLACRTAFRLGAKALLLGVTVVREENGMAVPAMFFSDTCHDPSPPGQTSDTMHHMGRKELRKRKKTGKGFKD
jgi:hypothetical protein